MRDPDLIRRTADAFKCLPRQLLYRQFAKEGLGLLTSTHGIDSTHRKGISLISCPWQTQGKARGFMADIIEFPKGELTEDERKKLKEFVQ